MNKLSTLAIVGSAAITGCGSCTCNSNQSAIDRPGLSIPVDGEQHPNESDGASGKVYAKDAGTSGSDGNDGGRECEGRRELIRGRLAEMLYACIGDDPDCPTVKKLSTYCLGESILCCQESQDPIACCSEDPEASEDTNEAFQSLCQAGIFCTTPEGAWRVNDTVSSAEFAAIAVRLLHLEPIYDPEDQTWFLGYYRALAEAGILPSGEDQNPGCPPSQEFVDAVLKAVCN